MRAGAHFCMERNRRKDEVTEGSKKAYENVRDPYLRGSYNFFSIIMSLTCNYRNRTAPQLISSSMHKFFAMRYLT